MTRARAVAVAAALCLLAMPAAASATNVTSAQLRLLAGRAAAGSAPALASLNTVTAVDGQPTAIAPLLQGASASQARARALVLARAGTAGPTAPVSATRERALATSILAESRYGKATIPDPLDSALNAVGRALGSLASQSPGGPLVFWAAAAALVLALAAIGARRSLRRLEPARRAGANRREGSGEDPAILEQAARDAEAAGAYDEAVRLRFRAGLLRLGSRSAIDYRPSLLAADVARRLDSRRFESLNDSFERIVYGGAAAEPEDALAAREGWTEVLERAGDGP